MKTSQHFSLCFSSVVYRNYRSCHLDVSCSHSDYSSFEFNLKCFQVQKRRELLATELNERMVKTADLIPTKVADFIMDKIENIRTKGSIDCRLVSQHMAFTIMGATFFGDGFLAWPKAAIYEELLMMISKDACFWASYNVTPFWRQGFWRYQCLCKKLKFLTHDILQHCRKCCKLFGHIDQKVNVESNIEMKSAQGEQCCSDYEFQDCYFFRDLKDNQNSKEEPCGNIMRVMFHGCQTTAALIADVLSRLVTHLEIQDKVAFCLLCLHCMNQFIIDNLVCSPMLKTKSLIATLNFLK